MRNNISPYIVNIGSIDNNCKHKDNLRIKKLLSINLVRPKSIYIMSGRALERLRGSRKIDMPTDVAKTKQLKEQLKEYLKDNRILGGK